LSVREEGKKKLEEGKKNSLSFYICIHEVQFFFYFTL
jgi:hypothetical protein